MYVCMCVWVYELVMCLCEKWNTRMFAQKLPPHPVCVRACTFILLLLVVFRPACPQGVLRKWSLLVWKCKQPPLQKKWNQPAYDIETNYVMSPALCFCAHFTNYGFFYLFFSKMFYYCCRESVVPHLVLLFYQNTYCLFLNHPQSVKCIRFNKNVRFIFI